MNCPVYRTLHTAINITTEYDLAEPAEEAQSPAV